jgi:hypothetical protein
MKSFADIKRRFAPGVVLQCIENTYRPEINGQRRTIQKVQTNALVCTLDGEEGRFWTALPPAKYVEILDADTFRIALGFGGKFDETHTVTLRFVGGAS